MSLAPATVPTSPRAPPKSRRPIPGPPRRVGRPPVVFPSPTANRSCPHPRYNRSPEGKVCPGEGKHRHLAASSPRRSFPRLARPLDSLRAEELTASPQRAPAGAPHKSLEPVGEGTYPAKSPKTEGALERLPSRCRHQPPNLFRHHYLSPPTGYTSPQCQKSRRHVTSGCGPAPSATAALGGPGHSAEMKSLQT